MLVQERQQVEDLPLRELYFLELGGQALLWNRRVVPASAQEELHRALLGAHRIERGEAPERNEDEAHEDHGIDVDRRDITIHGDVRVLGTYTATIDVHPDVDAKLTFDVVPEEEEE